MGSSREHPVPAANLAISKQRGEARVSYGDNYKECRSDELLKVRDKIRSLYLTARIIYPRIATRYVTVRQGNGIKSLSQFLSYGKEEFILKHLRIDLQRQKHKKLKDASTMDKIFIGGGTQLLVIMNGKEQVHHMKDKFIKDIVLIPTSNQNIQKIDNKQKISERANENNLQSVISEEQDDHHFHKF
ncbi:MAG: hypothetical protein EZS28_023296 [Streblomastix strix]|uniref:Uncharacterized protein n=1 Tax=Streblomastix strix TaxID=222440 RepID=A0A5J4VF42_9EUKA|nr:MAG: hypothetical protein EZS28_023296 [Streblomastix strix]